MSLASASDRSTRRVEEIWGTAISVDIRDRVDPRAVDDVVEWFRRVDDLFSTWRDETEISRIGRGELDAAHASPEVREVLALCERMRCETGGAFDITVGAHARIEPCPGLAPLDPSGLVKGWALERAAEQLEAAGVTRFCINAGGDVLVRSRPDDVPWRIGIQHPWQRSKTAMVVEMSHGAVATSGRTERGDHVIDPRSGLPATGLASATVIGPDLARADAFATAAFAGGSIGVDWIVDRGIPAMAITDERTVVTNSQFDTFRVR